VDHPGFLSRVDNDKMIDSEGNFGLDVAVLGFSRCSMVECYLIKTRSIGSAKNLTHSPLCCKTRIQAEATVVDSSTPLKHSILLKLALRLSEHCVRHAFSVPIFTIAFPFKAVISGITDEEGKGAPLC